MVERFGFDSRFFWYIFLTQTVDPPTTQAPSTPPIGHTEPRVPATTLESAPAAALTAAEFYVHMSTIMANFSIMISEKLGQTIDANRELSWKNTKLIRDKIRTMSKGLKANMKSNCDELSKGLVDLGQCISHKIAVAITATSEHSNSLNQASLQTIIDLLQNCTNVQVGNNPNATSLYTTLNAENYPESGILPGSQAEAEMEDPEVHHVETNCLTTMTTRMTRNHPLTANPMLKVLEMTTNHLPCPKDLPAHLVHGLLAGTEVKLNREKHPPVLTGNNSLPHTACLESPAYLLPAPWLV
jgi:hypothetical protein